MEEYVDYEKYDTNTEKISVIDGVKEFYNHTINKELLSMFTEPTYWHRICYELRHASYNLPKGLRITDNLYDLLDHHVGAVLSFEGLGKSFKYYDKLPILFSFPYLSIKHVKKYQDIIGDSWKMYWVNPRLFKYNNNAPSLCFVLNFEESDTALYLLNEYFLEKCGEQLVWKDDLLVDAIADRIGDK